MHARQFSTRRHRPAAVYAARFQASTSNYFILSKSPSNMKILTYVSERLMHHPYSK
jgi:hypothetical protein